MSNISIVILTYNKLEYTKKCLNALQKNTSKEYLDDVIIVDNSFKNVADKIDFIIGESHYANEMLPDHVLALLKRAGFKAKLLPIKNQYLFLNYENIYTGQKEKIEVRKPTLFIGERV